MDDGADQIGVDRYFLDISTMYFHSGRLFENSGISLIGARAEALGLLSRRQFCYRLPPRTIVVPAL